MNSSISKSDMDSRPVLAVSVTEAILSVSTVEDSLEVTIVFSISGEEQNAIKKVLKSGFWASGAGGGNVKKFEEKFSKYVNSKSSVAVNSGTAALNLALSMYDIKNKEVILPSLSFVATANAILENGGIPKFADIDENTASSYRMTAISKPVDVSSYEVPLNLHFKYAYARRLSDASEILIVMASENCGDSWSNLKAYNSTNLVTGPTSPDWKPSSKDDWKKASISLDKFKNATNLFIRFDVISQEGNSVYIDDINIGEFALSTPNYSDSKIWSVYPNPAHHQFKVKSEKNQVSAELSMVDLTGRLLLQQNLDSGNMTIDTKEIPNGLYFLLIKTTEGVWSKKLTISK